MEDVNVEALAAAAALGDQEAFAQLVRELQTPLWRFAYHLTRSRELADEVSQETWTRAVRALPRFRGDSTVLTWLMSIGRNAVNDHLRQQYRRRLVHGPAEPPEPWRTTELIEVEAELARLPPALAETLVLTQVVGLSYAETAVVTGVAVGTVRSRVFRARAALLEALGDWPGGKGSTT